jgi:hypothetical protein
MSGSVLSSVLMSLMSVGVMRSVRLSEPTHAAPKGMKESRLRLGVGFRRAGDAECCTGAQSQRMQHLVVNRGSNN